MRDCPGQRLGAHAFASVDCGMPSPRWILRATVEDGPLHWTGTGWTGPKRLALRFTDRAAAVRVLRWQRLLDWPVRLVRLSTDSPGLGPEGKKEP